MLITMSGRRSPTSPSRRQRSDLVVHQMAGFHPDIVRELYGIPKEFEPVAAIALGYPGDPESLPERLHKRELAPRERKPLTEFVFAGHWGKTSPVVAS